MATIKEVVKKSVLAVSKESLLPSHMIMSERENKYRMVQLNLDDGYLQKAVRVFLEGDITKCKSSYKTLKYIQQEINSPEHYFIKLSDFLPKDYISIWHKEKHGTKKKLSRL